MRWWWQPPCLLRVVILNVKDDPAVAIRGVLWSMRGPWLTVRQPVLLRAGGEQTTVDGEVVIHRDNVSFMQVVP
jgi:hypothetical protein